MQYSVSWENYFFPEAVAVTLHRIKYLPKIVTVQETEVQGQESWSRPVKALPLYPLEVQFLPEKAEEKTQLYFSYHQQSIICDKGDLRNKKKRLTKINQFLSS